MTSVIRLLSPLQVDLSANKLTDSSNTDDDDFGPSMVEITDEGIKAIAEAIADNGSVTELW